MSINPNPPSIPDPNRIQLYGVMHNGSWSSDKKLVAMAENSLEIERLLDTMVFDIRNLSKLTLQLKDINFTRVLTNSIRDGMDGRFRVVGFVAYYAPFVEYGIPPGHRANFGSIRFWVEGKLGINDPDEAQSVAWAVWLKILKKGIAPTRFFKKAIKLLIATKGAKGGGRGTVGGANKAGSKKKKQTFSQKFAKSAKKAIKRTTKGARKANRAARRFNKAVKFMS